MDMATAGLADATADPSTACFGGSISVNRVLNASSVQPQERPTTSQQVHGVWSLVTYLVEVKESDETFPPMGNNPSGYVIFTPEGRLAFTLSAEGRQAAESIEDSAGLLSSMIAYTGTYTLEDNRWITRVDVAWNPEWVGTEQTRYFRIDDDRLTVTTPWRVMPNWPEKGLTRSIVTFQRCR